MTYKQAFIINSDLDMGKGKIAVQVAHGEVYYMEAVANAWFESEKIFVFQKWRAEEGGLMKKVVLKATEKDMNDFISKLREKNICSYQVHDAGLTQVNEGSFTCLVVEPLEENVCDELFGHLKLL